MIWLNILNVIMIGLIVFSPVLVLQFLHRKFDNYKSIVIGYCVIGPIVLASLVVYFAWWNNTVDMYLLKYYGFDIDGFNEINQFRGVAAKNLPVVKGIVNGVMGIGWPLKAIFGMISIVPIMLIGYYVDSFVRTRCNKSKR